MSMVALLYFLALGKKNQEMSKQVGYLKKPHWCAVGSNETLASMDKVESQRRFLNSISGFFMCTHTTPYAHTHAERTRSL